MGVGSSLRPTIIREGLDVVMAAADPATQPGYRALAALPDDVAAALGDPPQWEKRLLQLSLRWPDPTPAATDLLRVYLLTWDPFEWAPARPPAVATSTRRPDGFGLALYLPYWQALALADADPAGLAGVLGRLGESVLAVAAEHQELVETGQYAAAAHAGTVPGLLSRVPDQVSLGSPDVGMVGPGWQDVQFDVLEDLAQEAFGPAELDRTPVEFHQPGDDKAGCPGCAGRPLGFPDGLKDAQTSICGSHRAEALKVITARLEQAKASNPAGWEGLLEAGRRLDEPHLPMGLAPRLAQAARVEDPTPEQLVDQVGLVVETARLTAGRLDSMRALGDSAPPVADWLDRLASAVENAGLGDAMVAAVAEAVDQLRTGGAPDEAEPGGAPPEPLRPPKPEPIRRGPRIGRNAPCPCGSGRKYKFCHGTARADG